MSKKSLIILLGLVSFVLFSSHPIFAANPPASQQMSGQERARQLEEQEQKLRKQVSKPKETVKTEEKTPEEAPEAPNAEKMLVKNINVTGVTLFSADRIKAITGKYENKELTLKELQKIADLITDLYRQEGYITSRAYLPPQKIEQGSLEIKVIEATVGDVQVKGNRFFSTGIIDRYVTLKKGDTFNYTDLKRDLQKINEHPDRNVKAVLAPGKAPGSTDVLLDVKDSLPIHVSVGYDNFLSRFLRRNDYTTTVTDNNLLGQDDIFTVQYNRADANDYYYYSARYLYPVTKSLDMGVFFARSRMVLGREFTDVNSRGKSKMVSLYGRQNLVKNDNLDLALTFGFDYKDVYNFLQGSVSSRDKLRVARTGLDFDMADDLGRTLISDDFNYGIPGIMGGTKSNLSSTDMPTSRAGADGQFVKDTLNLLRLQKLPFDSTLLWKNQLQFSPSILTATEQFQAGGPANNRGYTPAEFVGDRGYAMSWEMALPPYFIPKSYKTPLLNSRIYDALRFIGFYDWTNLHLKELQAGDKKNRTLRSAGCGVRLSLADNLFARYEIGWPLDSKPADGKNVHHWIALTATF